eukprot:EG_transcript_18147
MPIQQGGQPEELSAGLTSMFRNLCVVDRASWPEAGLLGDAPCLAPRRCGSKAGRLPPPITPCTATEFATGGSSLVDTAPPALLGAPDPATPPSGTATSAHVFVHSPYSFPPSPTDWVAPGTPLGMEVPPMDPIAQLSYTTPALAGVGPTQRLKLLRGGDPVPASPAPAQVPLPPGPRPDPVPSQSARAKGDPVAQSECPHPKPWKRRRAQRGFAFYVCLRCQHEWRVVTPKARQRRQERQAQALGHDSVPV